jgi:hypothetical protein
VIEAETLFENVLARYVWRYIHVTSHANINLPIWEDMFSLVLDHCYNKIVAIFEAVFDKWEHDVNDFNDFQPPDQSSFDSERIYYMAMEKRRYRRKSSAVRRYEDVDEYVDNMYLNE